MGSMVKVVTNRERFPDDIVHLLYLRMTLDESADETCQVKYQDEAFYTVLFKYKKRYPSLLSEFSFKLNGTYPYSELIDRIKLRAQLADLISPSQDSQSNFTMKSDIKEVIKGGTESKFSSSELQILDKIASDISQYNQF